MDTTQQGAVIGVVNDLFRDFAAKDIDAMLSHYAPNATGFGTGADEKFSGRDQLRAGFTRDTSQADSGRFSLVSSEVGISGNVAWISAEVEISVEIPGQGEMAFPARVSLVLQNYDGRWLVEHHHLSVPAANQEEGQSF